MYKKMLIQHCEKFKQLFEKKAKQVFEKNIDHVCKNVDQYKNIGHVYYTHVKHFSNTFQFFKILV